MREMVRLLPVAGAALGGKGERDVQNSEQDTACGTIALECEAFLDGTLAEYWDEKGIDVPVWAWMNLLAHGTRAPDRRVRPRRPNRRRTGRSWRVARSYLAFEVLDLTDLEFTLADMQSSVLIPLELEMAARPDVAGWTPRQWVDLVEDALRSAPLGPGSLTGAARLRGGAPSSARRCGPARAAAGSRPAAPGRGTPAGRSAHPVVRRPRRAAGRSRAGRPCRPGPGRGTRCTGRSRTSISRRGRGVCAAIQSTACLAGPAHGVQARCRRPAGWPATVRGEQPHAGEVVAVEAHLVGQPLAVEAPALGAGGVEEHLAGRRQVLGLHGDGELEVVARDRLVEGDVLGRRSGAAPRAARC